MANRIKGFCKVESNDHHVRIAREQLSDGLENRGDSCGRRSGRPERKLISVAELNSFSNCMIE